MRTQGTLAGALLLLLLAATTRSATINGRIKPKREATNTTQAIPLNDDVKEQTTAIPVANNSQRINNDLLSSTDSQNVVSKPENVQTSADQQVDQSQTVLIKDIENMEDALSIMEYEPQKINRKDKRKISVPYKNPEIMELNGEDKNPVSTMIGNTYYEPAPITKPKKTIPRYYSNPSQESPPSLDGESKSRDTEYSYPTPIQRSHKSRSSKNRPSVNSQITASLEETKLENPPPTSIIPSPRPYSSSSSELKKQRHNVDAITTSIPSNNHSQSTKSVRRKKIRKRPSVKATNKENINNRSKSRRVGSSSSINSAKVTEESNLKKLDVEGVAFNPDGRSININQPNAANNKDEEHLSKMIDPVRSPLGGLNRKAYEKKHIKEHPISQMKVEDGPLSSEEKEKVPSHGGYYNSPLEDKIVYKDGSKLDNEDSVSASRTYGDHEDSRVYRNDRTFVTPSSFEDEDGTSPDTSSLKSYRDHKKNVRTSVTPSNFEDEDGTSPDTSSLKSYRDHKKNVRTFVTPSNFEDEDGTSPDTSSLNTYRDHKKNVRTSVTPSNFEDEDNTSPDTSSLKSYRDHKKNVRTSVTPSSFEDEDDNTPLAPKSYRDHKDSDTYENIRTSVTPSSFEDYENTPPNSRTSKNVPPSSLESYEVIDEDSKVPTVTPSTPIFYTVKAPTVTVYSVGPPRPTDHSHYPSSASTLPVHRFEASTWTPKTKLKRLRESKLEEEDDRRSSDIIAEATNLGDDVPIESKENRRSYEDDSSNEHGDDYHRDREVYRNRGNHGHHDERYAQKYDEKNDDVQAEGTHGEEKYEGSKEGDGGKGKGGGKGEFEEGEGAKHEEGHHKLEDEKGEKGYESWHKEEKGNKGHHDKEQHSNHYEEEDAKKKEHKEDGEYHEEHQQGEKGEKAAEFDEKGKHQKGYNTKGEHSVHKKDEFEKRTEFFDEFNEGGDIEKDGEFHREHESSKGGHEKVGHLDKGEHEEHFGKEGKHENGKHHHEEEGHKLNEGKEAHYEHEDMHGGKKGQEEEKKWAYKKGDGGGDGGKDGGKGHESDH